MGRPRSTQTVDAEPVAEPKRIEQKGRRGTPDMIRDMVAEDEQAYALYGNGAGYVENAKYIVFAERCGSFGYCDLTDEVQIIDRTESYLKLCVQFRMLPSIPSYALALGTTAHAIESLLLDKTANKDAIKAVGRGISMIETIFVNGVVDKKVNPVTAVFMLKNHFGYKDQTEISLRGAVSHTVDAVNLESKYQAVIDV